MDFEGFSDASLMAFMAMQAQDPDTAKAAFGEFYERHRGFLGPVINRRYGAELGGSDAADEMTIEVFWRAYEYCGRAAADDPDKDFESDFHDDDPERSRLSVRAWLSTTAKNLFIDWLRGEESTPDELVFEPEELSEQIEPEKSPPMSPELVRMVRGALDTLPPKQREALEACLPWYDPVSGVFDMGRDAPVVAKSLGTSVDNLKRNRLRAVKQLQELDLPLPSSLSSPSETAHE